MSTSITIPSLHYPRFLMLMISIALAAFLLYINTYPSFHSVLLSLNYLGIFFAGMLYTYGFTTAPAAALLISLAKEYNIVVAALVGGIGALIADLFIFQMIRTKFSREIKFLLKTKIIRLIRKEEKKLFGSFQPYVNAIFAGLIIASPLPDELGIGMLASLKHISVKKFAIIAYAMDTMGIFIILLVGNVV